MLEPIFLLLRGKPLQRSFKIVYPSPKASLSCCPTGVESTRAPGEAPPHA